MKGINTSLISTLYAMNVKLRQKKKYVKEKKITFFEILKLSMKTNYLCQQMVFFFSFCC